ncbi:DUF496 family protein [Vibrio sp.]|nr:DUF496 family protein [Vibrio sp.]
MFHLSLKFSLRITLKQTTVALSACLNRSEEPTMSGVFEIVNLARQKNKLKRELSDNEKKVRDNQKRADLLANLVDYLEPGMSYDEIVVIVKNMRSDYEDRIDDHIIKSAEISKQRRELSRRIRDLTIEDKQQNTK